MSSAVAIPEHKLSESPTSRSIEINDWLITTSTNPISNAFQISDIQAALGFPLPEMTFGNNFLTLQHHSSGWSYSFSAEYALKEVKNGEFEEGDGGVKVGYADAWLKSRTDPSSLLPMPKTIITKPYDWTYTTTYTGHSASESLSWRPAETDNTCHSIPFSELTRPDPILFYAEIPLFEDELHDNGSSSLLVRIRVMPTCIFILSRFILRVDNVLFRTHDTRVYHSFSSKPPLIVRETSGWEAPYDRVAGQLQKRDDLTPLTDPAFIGKVLTELPSQISQREVFAMDVSNILNVPQNQSTTVEKETALQLDAGFLTVLDPNRVDEESYSSNLEEYLQSTARDGTQTLLASLFSLPTLPSPDGPLAQLPAPTTHLPRAKPLPKPKPPTKWERFAAAKGIQHKSRDMKVWDEERQDWVNRWGRAGRNKQAEEQWITEVPLNADATFDPAKIARNERKERVAKNEQQRIQNTARTMPNEREERKRAIDKTLATTRVSTASMGRFDKKLEGEKKMKGVKRKFDPTEAPTSNETKASLALISKLQSDAKKIRKEPAGESILNTRKAVRFASQGRGAIALGREASGEGGKKTGRKHVRQKR